MQPISPSQLDYCMGVGLSVILTASHTAVFIYTHILRLYIHKADVKKNPYYRIKTLSFIGLFYHT